MGIVGFSLPHRSKERAKAGAGSVPRHPAAGAAAGVRAGLRDRQLMTGFVRSGERAVPRGRMNESRSEG